MDAYFNQDAFSWLHPTLSASSLHGTFQDLQNPKFPPGSLLTLLLEQMVLDLSSVFVLDRRCFQMA